MNDSGGIPNRRCSENTKKCLELAGLMTSPFLSFKFFANAVENFVRLIVLKRQWSDSTMKYNYLK